MAKYSTEYKLKIVREYLAGQGGYRALSKRHEITESQIEHSEHVAQGELSGQQRDGELLWPVKARDLLWARLP